MYFVVITTGIDILDLVMDVDLEFEKHVERRLPTLSL
jgi:hypothetical protein